MEQVVNKNLISLKFVLFFFLGGVGCIFPFLPLHMLAVGLDKGEARLISAVVPCIALLGPAILGPLIDKLSVGRGSTGGGTSSGGGGSGRLLRFITAGCLLLSAVFYLLLLTVPYTERHEARRPTVLFMCDEDGAYVMQEVCTEGMRCNQWNGVKSGVLAVRACQYGCADDNMTQLTQTSDNQDYTTPDPYGDNDGIFESLILPEESEDDTEYEINPPHLCSDGNCLVYMQHAARMRVPLSLRTAELPTNHSDGDLDPEMESDWCMYTTANSFQCLTPPEKLKELRAAYPDCKPAVHCRVLDPYDEPGGVLADAQCRLVVGDPDYTFWTYFVIRSLAEIWPTAALGLLGAACVIATRETSLGRGDVGRQLAFGTLGLVIFPPLARLAGPSYVLPFALHAGCMVVAALILIMDGKMPLSPPEWWWHTASGVLAMPMNTIRRYGAEIAGLFAVLVLLGILFGAIDAYLPWTVVALNGTDTQVGLTMLAGALPAVPALYWAEALVDFLGHSNVFIMAFTFYCIRYTGLAFSTNYSWVVASEVLEVFTLSLVWVTAVLYFRHLVPRKYTVTGQALPVIAHFCLGRCLGALIGGLVTLDSPLESGRAVQRALAVCALLAAAVYLALYHLLLAPRCAAPAAPPPHTLLAGLNTNGSGTNGAYSPMRVYHEERSRKGHFRY